MFARSSGPERRIPSRTSGERTRLSSATKAISSSAVTAKPTSVCASPPPCSGAVTTGRDPPRPRQEEGRRRGAGNEEGPAPAELGQQAADDEPSGEADGGEGG